jgi:hypothetical protein
LIAFKLKSMLQYSKKHSPKATLLHPSMDKEELLQSRPKQKKPSS